MSTLKDLRKAFSGPDGFEVPMDDHEEWEEKHKMWVLGSFVRVPAILMMEQYKSKRKGCTKEEADSGRIQEVQGQKEIEDGPRRWRDCIISCIWKALPAFGRSRKYLGVTCSSTQRKCLQGRACKVYMVSHDM
jgi:hypothetical protein